MILSKIVSIFNYYLNTERPLASQGLGVSGFLGEAEGKLVFCQSGFRLSRGYSAILLALFTTVILASGCSAIGVPSDEGLLSKSFQFVTVYLGNPGA